MQRVPRNFGLLLLGIVIVTCSEPSPSRLSAPLPYDPTLDTAKMASLRVFEQGGCAISAPDSAGVVRALTLPRNLLPFRVAPITRDKASGKTNARGVSMTMTAPDGTPVTVRCLLANVAGFGDLAKALQQSDSAAWRAILWKLKRARVVPPDHERKPLTREAEAFRGEMIAPLSSKSAALRDQICKEVSMTWSWYSNDSWVFVRFTITICEEAGPVMFWWFDNTQYGNDPYVIVDANRYNIQQLDTVSFEARWQVGNGFPTLLGWQWIPAEGTVDPWTTVQPCLNTGPVCRTRIHGTGSMMFRILVNGEEVSGYVPITARVPEDAGYEGSDDPPGTEDWPSQEPEQRLSGPSEPAFAPLMWSGQISANQSWDIFAWAVGSGEWRYTQGCAHCRGGPNNELGPYTEPAVDRPNKIGDCSDLVWVAVGSVLGPLGWHHRKMSTLEYNSLASSSPSTLAALGFVEIDSAQVRPGDLVNRTWIGGSGHIGLFIGWGVGGHPIGWANNGSPATYTSENVDRLTKPFDFKVTPGKHTKFFRPIMP